MALSICFVEVGTFPYALPYWGWEGLYDNRTGITHDGAHHGENRDCVATGLSFSGGVDGANTRAEQATVAGLHSRDGYQCLKRYPPARYDCRSHTQSHRRRWKI